MKTIFNIKQWPKLFDLVISDRIRQLSPEMLRISEIEEITIDTYINELCKKNLLGFKAYNKEFYAAKFSLSETFVKYQKPWVDKMRHFFQNRLECLHRLLGSCTTQSSKQLYNVQKEQYEKDLETTEYYNFYHAYNYLWCENRYQGLIDEICSGKAQTYFNNGDYKTYKVQLDSTINSAICKKYKFPERFILQLIQNDCLYFLKLLPVTTAQKSGLTPNFWKDGIPGVDNDQLPPFIKYGGELYPFANVFYPVKLDPYYDIPDKEAGRMPRFFKTNSMDWETEEGQEKYWENMSKIVISDLRKNAEKCCAFFRAD